MKFDLDALFANSTSPYVLFDPELRMVWANRAYLDVTGRSRESIIGRLVSEEFPAPADSVSAEMLQGSFRRVLKTGQVDHLPLIPYPIKGADGRFESRYWSATHTPIVGTEGHVEFILQNTMDVTDLHSGEQAKDAEDVSRNAKMWQRAEAVASENLALGKVTEFFQSAFDQSPSFMAVLHGPDHIFQIVNQAYTDLIGNRDVVGLSVREALPEINGQGFYELLDQVFHSGESVSVKAMPAQIQANSNTPPEQYFVDFIFYPLKDADGLSKGIFVQGHDITGQKIAEAEVIATRDKFRKMAQTMPVHVWTADKDGGLNWLNLRTYEFTGYAEGDLYGAGWLRVLHPDDCESAIAEWTTAIQKGLHYETEFRIRKVDGSFRWHIVRASPLRAEDGTLTGWVGTNTDIEERKSTEAEIARLNSTLEERVETRNRELEALNAELRQSQKLEAIGSLAGGIAHDFNNLLQVVMGNLQITMRSMPQVAPEHARLDQAMKSVKRGATLASQLLSFARKQPLAPLVINLKALIAENSEILHSAVGEGANLETQFQDDLWNTSVDTNSMENALLNLVLNARDAMEGHGTLNIQLSNVDLDDSDVRAHSGAEAGQYVNLKVTDTGRGMSPETLARVFEPFFTTKMDGQGTGLGLSMVYGFAKQSGGHVSVNSMLGVGTTMNIYLPRSLEPVQMVQPMPNAGLSGGSETILLVEDDEDVRETAFHLLTSLGYSVLQASNADHAQKILEEGHEIDLLFSDVVMPGKMSGHQLAERLRGSRPDVPVLFTSGFVQDAIFHDGRLDEGVELISKPYTEVELARKIREILGYNDTLVKQVIETEYPVPAQDTSSEVAKPKGVRILLCEDDALIRMDLSEILRDAGHEVLESANAGAALDLLEVEQVNLLITDVGLPDRTGEELVQDARGLNADLPVLFATGGNDVPSATLLAKCKVLTKPFSGSALLAAVEALMLAS